MILSTGGCLLLGGAWYKGMSALGGGVCSLGVPGPGGCLLLGGAWSWQEGAWWRPPRTATAAEYGQ